LWLLGPLAAVVLWRRPRLPARAADRMAPLLYALTTGLLAAWRAAATEHRLRHRHAALPEAAWRGGESATMALRSPGAAPVVPGRPQTSSALPGASAEAGPSKSVEAIQKATETRSPLLRWWLYLKELFARFNKDMCPVFAASLSFFGLISLVPILLMAIAALGYLIHNPDQARVQIIHAIQHLLPGETARKAAQQLMDQIGIENQIKVIMSKRGVAGVVGIVTLIWAAIQIFVSSVPAMNAAWEVTEKRNWLKLRLTALGLLVGAGALFLLSLLPSAGPDLVRRLHIPWLGLPEHVPWYVDLLFTLLALAINAAMFTLIYRYLPAAQVQWREAAVGGVAMGLLWELAKQGFSLYLSHAGAQNVMYGALGGVMLLVTWIYYTSMLLLLGTEVSKLYKDIWDYCHRGSSSPATSGGRQG